MERSAWARMPVAALLLSWAKPAPCAAQPPVPPSTSPPAITPRDGGGASDLPPALPMPPASPRAPGGGAAATSPNPLATGLTLKPAPLEPTDLRFPINLATALRLSDARPLIVAAAQASVWVAGAELTPRTGSSWCIPLAKPSVLGASPDCAEEIRRRRRRIFHLAYEQGRVYRAIYALVNVKIQRPDKRLETSVSVGRRKWFARK